MTTSRTPTTRIRPGIRATQRAAVAMMVAAAIFTGTTSSALAGGGPPRPENFDLEAVYINCVDDEVDEPGIDGDALVRVRLHNDSPEPVTVVSGDWGLTIGLEIVQQGTFIAPADLEAGATWEQVVRILGGTGPALFRGSVLVSNDVGQTLIVLDPAVAVPGDCEQPDVPEDETPPPSDEPTPTTVATGAGLATPRFTG
jgi:hypothetical protein